MASFLPIVASCVNGQLACADSFEFEVEVTSQLSSPPPHPRLHEDRNSQTSAFISSFYPQPVLATIGTTGRTRGAAFYLILLASLAPQRSKNERARRERRIYHGWIPSYVVRDIQKRPAGLHTTSTPAPKSTFAHACFLAFRQAVRHSGLPGQPLEVFHFSSVLTSACSISFPAVQHFHYCTLA